ncbi:MAG: PIN domain-containing protein [Spirosomaceae bacterium]|jgi:predicted nucleic acid-binding protein|nr:PIN domain-containing protein [Spirosomataceae bacterium]
MRVVVDTSAVMSAIMSKNGSVADVLLNPMFEFERYSCYFMPVELFKHKPKLLQYSKLEETDLLDALYTTLRKIHLVNESLISTENWQLADELTKGVDNKDVSFVALSLHLDATLWTLDKKLIKHLREKGFEKVANTQELIDLLS